jgi:hypothetical protein
LAGRVRQQPLDRSFAIDRHLPLRRRSCSAVISHVRAIAAWPQAPRMLAVSMVERHFLIRQVIPSGRARNGGAM